MRFSRGKFNKDEFDIDPIFPTQSSCSDLVFPTESFNDSVVKMVRFGGETGRHSTEFTKWSLGGRGLYGC